MTRWLTPILLSLAFAAALGAETAAPPGSITFVAENTFSTANGSFRSWRITRAEVDPADPKSGVVEVEVDVASLETGIERRDEHLRTADFFDVAKHPKATVRVHDAEANGRSERGNPRYPREVRPVDPRRGEDARRRVRGAADLAADRRGRTHAEPHGLRDRRSVHVVHPGSIVEEVPVRFRATLPASSVVG
jgi:hypothetical protein